ncbi:MAG: hypothetical protein KAV41_02720 [Candidatus Pacebacteria bacterium]|nr:hypothetical protein [Candidatus Paceibacterota bacterium]
MGVREDVKKFKISRVLMLIFALFPLIVGAVTPQPANFGEVVMIVVEILDNFIPLIILLALIYFIWGLARYLKNAGENKDEAKAVMLHGIIAFFVMSSVWGLVGILTTTFGVSQHIPIETEFVDKGVKDSLKIYQEDLLKELESDTTELENMLPADYGGQVSWPADGFGAGGGAPENLYEEALQATDAEDTEWNPLDAVVDTLLFWGD